MSFVKSHHKLGTNYPEVLDFFKRKAQELELPVIPFLENLANLDIYIMDGILFDDKGMVYGHLFDGDEIQTNLVLLQNRQRKPFRVPSNRPLVVLSNYGDDTFIRATIVHEISHFVKNYLEGTTPDLSPNGRDEKVARDFEAQYLEESSYEPEDLNRYMHQKYLPQE